MGLNQDWFVEGQWLWQPHLEASLQAAIALCLLAICPSPRHMLSLMRHRQRLHGIFALLFPAFCLIRRVAGSVHWISALFGRGPAGRNVPLCSPCHPVLLHRKLLPVLQMALGALGCRQPRGACRSAQTTAQALGFYCSLTNSHQKQEATRQNLVQNELLAEASVRQATNHFWKPC